jgi:4-hydroxysphinganine ceramide fatty acyl 2-hydroxylase
MALPVVSRTELASHTTAKSCYVVLKNRVYDVTGFIHDHPGGADLILDHAGDDVEALMEDELSHFHTETAYEILDEFVIGRLEAVQNGHAALPDQNGSSPNADGSKKPVYDATGLSCAEDLSRETDFDSDYKTYHFLNLNKPLLMQVWNGRFSKDFYLQQVHRPRHYPGGDSAPLFGNFLEPLSKTPWWVVPLIWLPPISYGTYRATNGLSGPVVGMYWVVGLCIWTFVEYGLHRFLFHLDELVLAVSRQGVANVLSYLPDNRAGITLHFLLHGIHHYLPMDKYRLVMPPALLTILAIPFWHLAHTLFFYDWHAATAVFCGGLFGYVCYDLTHYFLHHRK